MTANYYLQFLTFCFQVGWMPNLQFYNTEE